MNETDKCEICGKTLSQLDKEAIAKRDELEVKARELFEKIKTFFPDGDIHSEDWCDSVILKETPELESEYIIPDFNLYLRVCVNLGLLERYEVAYGVPGAHDTVNKRTLKELQYQITSLNADIQSKKDKIDELNSISSAPKKGLLKKFSKSQTNPAAEIANLKKDIHTLEVKVKQLELDIKVVEGAISHDSYSLESQLCEDANIGRKILDVLTENNIPMTAEEIANSTEAKLSDINRVIVNMELNSRIFDFKVGHHKYYLHM